MSSGSFGKERSSGASQSQVQIPDFLRPITGQAAAIGGNTLSRLTRLLNQNRDFVADFTPDQLAAFQAVRDVTGSVLPQATNVLSQAAQGQGLSFLPSLAMQGIGGAIGADFLSPEGQAALSQIAMGQTGALPGTEALQQTAAGDFLMGGQGFDAAVDAAVRAARPGILSTFGSAGSGGGTGALAQAAIGQSAVDAFARQFAQERANQLGAAGQLANLGLAGQAQQLGALGQLAGINQAQAGLGLQAGGLLGGFADAERARQLQAAQALPGLSFAGIEPLLNIGLLQQQQAQQGIDAPIQRQLQLLGAALGIPSAFSPLFGENRTAESRGMGFSLGFGEG